MKKILKSPLFYMAIAICLIVIGLYLFGFRITYNPELDHNWDAISACAAWAAVIVAGFGAIISVYYAIQAPKKIAEEQNKIALFEKRYEVFQFYERCFDFCDRLYRHRDKVNLQEDCMLFFDDMKFDELNDDIVQNRIFEFEHTLHQLVFLFPSVSDDDVKDLYATLWRAVVAIVDNKDVELCRKAYVDTMKNFSDKYQKMIFTEMSIYKCK